MSYGTLAPDRGNVIVYPTSFSAQHHDTEWLVRPVGILDPSRCFIIVPNLFGNGPSCSPSNTPWPLTDNRFPDVTCHDAVRVQQRLPAEVFGIQRVKRVYGWSMGGMQAYHWAVARPDGRTHRGGLWLLPLRAAQRGIHRGRTGGVAGRSHLHRRCVHRALRARAWETQTPSAIPTGHV
jgi:hypothetical protein